jgi:hypothetical protein
MVTAISRLSNTFLHHVQGVEKSGETERDATLYTRESLEESGDWYFNFRARVKRPTLGFDDGQPR